MFKLHRAIRRWGTPPLIRTDRVQPLIAVAVGMWKSPQGFPRDVGSMESRLFGYPYFPHPGISMAPFSGSFDFSASIGLRMRCMPDSSGTVRWRTIANCGIGLLAIGLGAFGVDFFSMGRFEFIDDHYLFFLVAIAIGLLAMFIGLIGWAKHVGKQGRTRMGVIVFFAPIATCVLAGQISGTNVHGPFYLFLFTMIPLSVLGLALLFMAAAAPRN